MNPSERFAAFRPLATKRVELNGAGVIIRELTGLERDRLHTSNLATTEPAKFHALVVALSTGPANADPAEVQAAADYLVAEVSPEDVLEVSTAALDLSGLGGGADKAIEAASGN